MSLKRRIDRLQKLHQQLEGSRQKLLDEDRSRKTNLAKVMAYPEGPQIVERLSQLVPAPFDMRAIETNPEAREMALRFFEIVAAP